MASKPKRNASEADDAGHHSPGDDKPNTLTNRAYVEICRRIVRMEMQPGDSFTEGEIATELDLSKTPVREALLILATERLVFPRPRSGYRVSPITVRDARELFVAWSSVGPDCAARAAEAGVDQRILLHLEDLAQDPVDTTDDANVDDFVDELIDFHGHIAMESENERLGRFMRVLLYDVERLVRLMIQLSGKPRRTLVDHAKLLTALANEDATGAREAYADLIRLWDNAVLTALLESHAVQGVNLAGSQDI